MGSFVVVFLLLPFTIQHESNFKSKDIRKKKKKKATKKNLEYFPEGGGDNLVENKKNPT